MTRQYSSGGGEILLDTGATVPPPTSLFSQRMTLRLQFGEQRGVVYVST